MEELLGYLEASKAKQACAETNSLSRLKLDPARDYLYFICSDTIEGRLCGQALVKYYEKQGFYYNAPMRIEGLTPDHRRFQEVGLIHLINQLADLIETFDRRVIINATGGYKAQIAYATLLGLLYRVEVNYIHEDFAGMIQLPLLPVQFDFDLWRSAEEQIKAVLEAESKREARRLIDQLPGELRLLFEKSTDGDRYQLSPAGLALQRAADYSVRRTASNRIPLGVSKAHSTLWGDHIRYVDEVPDQGVRRVFRRIAEKGPLVKKIALGKMEPQRSDEVFFEFRKKAPGCLYYRISTPDGSEYLKIYCPDGRENDLLEALGCKISP